MEEALLFILWLFLTIIFCLYDIAFSSNLDFVKFHNWLMKSLYKNSSNEITIGYLNKLYRVRLKYVVNFLSFSFYFYVFFVFEPLFKCGVEIT